MSLPRYSATITAASIVGSNLVIEWTQSVSTPGVVNVASVLVQWSLGG